jgi:hypothetical protein
VRWREFLTGLLSALIAFFVEHGRRLGRGEVEAEVREVSEAMQARVDAVEPTDIDAIIERVRRENGIHR